MLNSGDIIFLLFSIAVPIVFIGILIFFARSSTKRREQLGRIEEKVDRIEEKLNRESGTSGK